MLGFGFSLTAVRRPPAGTLIIGPDFLSPLATFTRASGATGIRDWVLTLFGNDQPRFVNDPAVQSPVLLVEGEAINCVRNPRCEGGNTSAPIGSGGSMPTFWVRDTNASPSDIVTTFLGSGIENGMPYGDFRFQTSGAAGTTLRIQFEQHNGIAASSGQSWVLRYDYKLLAGALPNTAKARLIPRDSAESSISGIVDSILTVDGTRRTATVVMAAAPANTAYISGNFEFGWGSGQAFDFTIRIYSPQIEQNYLASSHILPPVGSPAAAIRAPDSLSVIGPQFAALFGAGAPQGCVIFDVVLNQRSPTTNPFICQLDDGTINNRLYLYNVLGTQLCSFACRIDGVFLGNAVTANSFDLGSPFRIGARWGDGRLGICMKGGSIASQTIAIPGGLNTMRIGGAAGVGGSPLNGRISLAAILPYAPGDAEFRALCTPGAPL